MASGGARWIGAKDVFQHNLGPIAITDLPLASRPVVSQKVVVPTIPVGKQVFVLNFVRYKARLDDIAVSTFMALAILFATVLIRIVVERGFARSARAIIFRLLLLVLRSRMFLLLRPGRGFLCCCLWDLMSCRCS